VDSPRRILVIGAGIVGCSVARELATDSTVVTVLERDDQAPRGSTAFAPGFVGVFNDVPVLTELARRSVEAYRSLGDEFTVSGGLELATTEHGVQLLEERVSSACAAGLSAVLHTAGELPDSVRSFVDSTRVTAVAEYLDDGVGVPSRLRATMQAAAEQAGAHFRFGHEVVAIEPTAEAYDVVDNEGSRFPSDEVVLAAGVWGPSLAKLVGLDLPLFPVAHPYVYAQPGEPRVAAGPFVRWPEHHVYARAHADQLGIGSYDHRPVSVPQNGLRDGAGLAWDDQFNAVIDEAQTLLRPEARFTPASRINGVFAMTPDNLPFLGRHPTMPQVWIAQALWITHAAGAAHILAQAIQHDIPIPPTLAVNRFAGSPSGSLAGSAMRLYRDIYASDPH